MGIIKILAPFAVLIAQARQKGVDTSQSLALIEEQQKPAHVLRQTVDDILAGLIDKPSSGNSSGSNSSSKSSSSSSGKSDKKSTAAEKKAAKKAAAAKKKAEKEKAKQAKKNAKKGGKKTSTQSGKTSSKQSSKATTKKGGKKSANDSKATSQSDSSSTQAKKQTDTQIRANPSASNEVSRRTRIVKSLLKFAQEQESQWGDEMKVVLEDESKNLNLYRRWDGDDLYTSAIFTIPTSEVPYEQFEKYFDNYIEMISQNKRFTLTELDKQGGRTTVFQQMSIPFMKPRFVVNTYYRPQTVPGETLTYIISSNGNDAIVEELRDAGLIRREQPAKIFNYFKIVHNKEEGTILYKHHGLSNFGKVSRAFKGFMNKSHLKAYEATVKRFKDLGLDE